MTSSVSGHTNEGGDESGTKVLVDAAMDALACLHTTRSVRMKRSVRQRRGTCVSQNHCEEFNFEQLLYNGYVGGLTVFIHKLTDACLTFAGPKQCIEVALRFVKLITAMG